MKGKYPESTREAFAIAEGHEDGIFQIETNKNVCLYDRTYLFTDINYYNMDNSEKKSILKQLITILNYMGADYKITISNEYMDLEKFLEEIFQAEHKDDYPSINTGMQQWMKELISRAEMKNLQKVLYLTITTRTTSYEEAQSYFLGMDNQLIRMFKIMGSVLVPLNGAQRLESIRKFITLDEDETEISFDNPFDDPILYAVPVDIDASEQNFMVFNGNRYVSVLFAKSVGRGVDEGEAIRELTNVSYPSFLTLDVAPVDKEVLINKLEHAHTINEKNISDEIDSKREKGKLMAGISYSRMKKKEELEDYLDQVDTNDEEGALASLLIVVSAFSEEDLADRVDDLIRKGKEKKIILDTYNYVQLKAFNTALPIGARLVDYMRAYLTSSLAAFQPFFAQDVIEPGGAIMGRNRTTNHIVMANRKGLASPHGFISGATGSGKSYLIKETEVSQTLLLTDDDMICIDPQNELEAVCVAFHGTYIDFTPQSQVYLNPMAVPQSVFKGNQKVQNQFVADVLGWANSFCESAMSGVIYTSDHRSAISRCIRGIYEELFAAPMISQQPNLLTLRVRIAQEEKICENKSDRECLHQLYNALDEYTEGVYDMFAHDTNIDMDNRFIVFGLRNVEEDAWQPIMITVMFFLSNRMEYNGECQRATRLLVDEAQVVTQNESSAKILLKAALTFRKFGGLCTFALQNLTRALELPDLRDMFQNCGYKAFLDQGGVDRMKLAEIQEFSAKEYEDLSTSEKGYCIMVWNKMVVKLDAQMSKDNILYDVFNTDFHEKAEKERMLLNSAE